MSDVVKVIEVCLAGPSRGQRGTGARRRRGALRQVRRRSVAGR